MNVVFERRHMMAPPETAVRSSNVLQQFNELAQLVVVVVCGDSRKYENTKNTKIYAYRAV